MHIVPYLERALIEAKLLSMLNGDKRKPGNNKAKEGKTDGDNEGKAPLIVPSMVNITSRNGKQSFPSCMSYCMKKAIVDMMTWYLSVDLVKDGIHINSVNPRMVPMQLAKREGMADGKFLKRQVEVTYPLGAYLGRFSRPVDVGALVIILILDRDVFVTGERIAMDDRMQNLSNVRLWLKDFSKTSDDTSETSDFGLRQEKAGKTPYLSSFVSQSSTNPTELPYVLCHCLCKKISTG